MGKVIDWDLFADGGSGTPCRACGVPRIESHEGKGTGSWGKGRSRRVGRVGFRGKRFGRIDSTVALGVTRTCYETAALSFADVSNPAKRAIELRPIVSFFFF